MQLDYFKDLWLKQSGFLPTIEGGNFIYFYGGVNMADEETKKEEEKTEEKPVEETKEEEKSEQIHKRKIIYF